MIKVGILSVQGAVAEHERAVRATLHSLDIEGEVVKNGAWSHPKPEEAAKNIKGYIVFAYGEIQVQTERGG